jgi:putative integral membrane protein (TIGR02587 family)
MPAARQSEFATTNRQYAVALTRAFAGATIFCLPLLMTMEMWWLGFTLHPGRLLTFSIANFALLYGLSHVAGFEASHNWLDDVLDAFAAYAVAAITSAVALSLFGIIEAHMPVREIAGKIAMQAVPASFGAMIGAKLLGEGEEIERQEEHWRESHGGRLFLALAGAMFLSFTVAPTEEMRLIAYQMTPWHSLLLVLLSILALHAIVYLVGFPGQQDRSGGSHRGDFIHRTLPAYGISVAACFYVLWCLGSIDGASPAFAATSVAVLGFPAAIGAGLARVVI